MLQLNLLAPVIRKSILDGTQSRTMSMEMFKKPWPDVWGADSVLAFQSLMLVIYKKKPWAFNFLITGNYKI